MEPEFVTAKSDLYLQKDGTWTWMLTAVPPDKSRVYEASGTGPDPASCHATIREQLVAWFGEPAEEELLVRMLIDGKRGPDGPK